MKTENQRKTEFLSQPNVSQDDFNYVKAQLPIWYNDTKLNFDAYSAQGLKPVSDNDLLTFVVNLTEILHKIELEIQDRGL